MPYRKWKTAEQQNDKPMRQLLIELYEKFGDHEAVREFLGVSQKGLRDWITAVDCKPVVRLQCDHSEPPPKLTTTARHEEER